MSAIHFFPSPALAWTFFVVLIALLSVAAVIDLRRVIVPKWLSLTTLALGFLFNLTRGAWVGSLDREVWVLGANGAVVGAADGFLLAFVGFLTGFAFFFLMWILGACGGGDVKLFAAVSAWVGPWIALWILVLSTIVLFVMIVVKVSLRLLFKFPQATSTSAAENKSLNTGAPNLGRGLTYSLPLALATAMALLWFFRFDLNLAQPLPLHGSSQLNTAAVVR